MSNLVTNEKFTSNLTGWTLSSSSGPGPSKVSGQGGITGAPVATACELPSGDDQISQTINGLLASTTYYVRFYVYQNGTTIGGLDFSLTSSAGTLTSSNNSSNLNKVANTFTYNTNNSQYSTATLQFTLSVNANVTIDFLSAIGGDTVTYRVTSIYVGTSSNYCFNKGTKILCLRDNIEQYVPIEQLQKSDLVKTHIHGYRKIDYVLHSLFKNDVTDFTKSMYVMPKHDGMTDDLIVTGGHSILVDEYESEHIKNHHKHLFGGELDPIDDKHLLLAGQSPVFKQIQGDDLFDVYHLCLEGETPEHDRRYGVWANGVLTESTYKKVIYNMLHL